MVRGFGGGVRGRLDPISGWTVMCFATWGKTFPPVHRYISKVNIQDLTPIVRLHLFLETEFSQAVKKLVMQVQAEDPKRASLLSMEDQARAGLREGLLLSRAVPRKRVFRQKMGGGAAPP